MHGNNPTRDSIEQALTHHAQTGAIKAWTRHPDFGRHSGAPKWRVTLAGNARGPQGDGDMEIRTYQEGKLICAALASAETIRALDVLKDTTITAVSQIDEWIAKSMNGFTQEELSEAFQQVMPQDGWKNPIDCRLGILTDTERRAIDTAITHFTGGVAEWTRDGDDGDWIVTAPGYYACIGS